MKIFRFNQEVGKQINAFGSNFVMSRIGNYHGEFQLGCMHIDKYGLVGRHEATTNQLFLVIEGEGWVTGETDEKLTIKAGEAAFWIKGENHAAGTGNNTMKAIVLEGENVDPAKLMSE
ncbi:cupin [Anaerobacillus alkaliphilus]|uniref:Cupin n=1 Tax=Anaerobacillus alkaliphilus TaxID=1548597 RepID=A0A4Q0W136_9BACI|nr:cupin [Anaerobacillus alkaliphilus]RXJ04361.1 cupin [Anaerobacillus alkaliphilus]